MTARYSRQFLVTDRPCRAPDGTQPDLGVETARGAAGEVMLIGYAVDAEAPERSDAEIAGQLANLEAPEELAEGVGRLGGRFVIIAETEGDRFILHDACGLRSVFHSTHRGRCALASQRSSSPAPFGKSTRDGAAVSPPYAARPER